MEAAAVLYRAEQRLGNEIPEEDLTAGKLGKYLKPEDYQPIKQVSSIYLDSLSGVSCSCDCCEGCSAILLYFEFLDL